MNQTRHEVLISVDQQVRWIWYLFALSFIVVGGALTLDAYVIGRVNAEIGGLKADISTLRRTHSQLGPNN